MEEPVKETSIQEEPVKSKGFLSKGGIFLATVGIVITVFMAAMVIFWAEELRNLQHYGYLGAFFISILGGATAVVPVPMIAIIFALGGVMPHPWLVALAAALGELLGGLTIYLTGHGAGMVLAGNKHGIIQSYYERMLSLMERRGSLTLFIVASVVIPFFYPASLCAGALRFGLKKYALIVFSGKLVKNMIVVYAGYWGISSIFRAIDIQLF